MHHLSPHALSLLITVLVLLPVLYFRMRKMVRPQPLKWQYLWVRPVIFIAVATMVLASAPPPMAGLPWLGLAGVLGAMAGWQWGRSMAIEMHPENGTLMVKGGQAAMLVLVVLVLLRVGLKTGLQFEASAWHLDLILITDTSIIFSVAMFAVRGLEMFLRAQRVMQQRG